MIPCHFRLGGVVVVLLAWCLREVEALIHVSAKLRCHEGMLFARRTDQVWVLKYARWLGALHVAWDVAVGNWREDLGDVELILVVAHIVELESLLLNSIDCLLDCYSCHRVFFHADRPISLLLLPDNRNLLSLRLLRVRPLKNRLAII